MVFVNREGELAEWKALIRSGSANLALLYGRRRLGKTALLRHLLGEHGGLYFQVPDQAASGILRHRNDRMRQATGRPIEYATLRDFLFDPGSPVSSGDVADSVRSVWPDHESTKILT